MAKNKIDDLRNHLFETLEALKDEEKPMDLDRARAIAQVAKVLVDSAKVEVDFIRTTGALTTGTGFIPEGEDVPASVRRRFNGTKTERPALPARPA